MGEKVHRMLQSYKPFGSVQANKSSIFSEGSSRDFRISGDEEFEKGDNHLTNLSPICIFHSGVLNEE